ncbi:hypothetical protein PSHT_08572 [Puccinia striiformis]|uniref:Uncharacterized protein n=1 Tax=Puccinia striiformis TaxID=27350 RepID=A0A2S4VMV3_9BASI|nr:hypothetical protein PSHT_08572 [Puccinia striiformis]
MTTSIYSTSDGEGTERLGSNRIIIERMPKAHSKDYHPAAQVGAPATITPYRTSMGRMSPRHSERPSTNPGGPSGGRYHLGSSTSLEEGRDARGDDSALLSSSSSNVVQPNTAIDRTTSMAIHPPNPAQRTIVIHPGSRTVQIGRASDSLPISIPNVVARRRVPGSGKQPLNGLFRNCEPYSTSEAKETFTSKTNAIRTELRSRMRAIKLRGITNGQGIAANHNADAAPLTLSEDQDPLGTVWPPISGPEAKDLYTRSSSPEPEKNNYAVRWPIVRGQLNSTDDSGYLSKAEVLADIETVWLYALSTHLGIKEQDLKEYSAILILPDIYDHVYLREMVDLLFRALGFKQICLQQESLCACFGAGLGTACVVDIGATKTSVSCVEEGWVLPETRIQLAIGGDDITTVLAEMLRRQNFPYKDLNLNCTWEWQMIEKLKEDMLVLSEGDVNLSSFTFFVRHPQKPTVKWSVRAYDEVIIPAMILFSPSIIEFDRKQSLNKRIYADKEDVDDVGNPITEAMRNSTSISVFGKPATAVVSTGANVTDPTRLTVARTEESVTGTAEEGASPYTGTPQPTTLGIESNAPTPRPSPNVPGPKPATNSIVPAEAAMTPSAAFVSAVSKIPLHEALVQSILACASEERSKRMASAIMVVGGGALILI